MITDCLIDEFWDAILGLFQHLIGRQVSREQRKGIGNPFIEYIQRELPNRVAVGEWARVQDGGREGGVVPVREGDPRSGAAGRGRRAEAD